MPSPTPSMVTTPAAAVAAVQTFNREISKSPGLVERLAYHRAWYAVPESPDGHWLFGPSKFIGYAGLTAEAYLDPAHPRDGRQTEAQLQRWFRELDPTSMQYADLAPMLSSFLGRYGKAPSRKARINVLREPDSRSSSELRTSLIDLLVGVAETLAPADLELLVRRLKGIQPR